MNINKKNKKQKQKQKQKQPLKQLQWKDVSNIHEHNNYRMKE